MWGCLGGPLTWFLSPSQTSKLGRGDQDLTGNRESREPSSRGTQLPGTPSPPPPAKEIMVETSRRLRRAEPGAPRSLVTTVTRSVGVTIYNEEKGL